MSPDGTEKEEVTMQGPPQELISIDDGDSYSRVIKRVVLKSDTEQSEVRPHNALRLTYEAVTWRSEDMEERAGLLLVACPSFVILWNCIATISEICCHHIYCLRSVLSFYFLLIS